MEEKRGLPSKDILAEIDRKSQEIMRSNEELAEKLRQNQMVISRFSTEFESLKSELGTDNMDSATRKQLEHLKSELEDKKKLISEMIDDLEPVELDLSRREDEIAAFRQRIDDQARKIESLSRDLIENRKQSESLITANNDLRKSMAEKDGMIKVLKDKLAEKASLLKDVDEKNRSIEQQAESYRKQVFALDNKVKAIEGRVFSTDEQNQKLLYEMMRNADKVKSLEVALADKSLALEAQHDEFNRQLESLRKEESEKRSIMMQTHAKRVATLNSTIDILKSKLLQQQKVVEEKFVKEREIISDFSTRMREALSKGPDISMDDLPHFTEPLEPGSAYPGPPAEPAFSFSIKEEESGGSSNLPSKMDEIIPMIELAVEHGDDIGKIRHSLHSSGYSQKDVSAALSKLNLIEH